MNWLNPLGGNDCAVLSTLMPRNNRPHSTFAGSEQWRSQAAQISAAAKTLNDVDIFRTLGKAVDDTEGTKKFTKVQDKGLSAHQVSLWRSVFATEDA